MFNLAKALNTTEGFCVELPERSSFPSIIKQAKELAFDVIEQQEEDCEYSVCYAMQNGWFITTDSPWYIILEWHPHTTELYYSPEVYVVE